MSKSNRIWFEKDLLKSAVFRSLSGMAHCVYNDLKLKCQMQKVRGSSGRKSEWTIKNNGEIVYTYSQAEGKGINRQTFVRCLDRLIENGLIDLAHPGSGGVKGDVSKYAISDRWRKFGTDDFEKRSRQKDTRKGLGFSVVHERRREKERIPKNRHAIVLELKKERLRLEGREPDKDTEVIKDCERKIIHRL